MAIFESLGETAAAPDILKMSPSAGIALIDFHEALLRGPSPLTEGEREFIATYVSGLNNCRYCFTVHSACAESYGYSRDQIDGCLADIGTADIDHKLVPLLKVAKTLTEKPSGMTEALAQGVYAAGWGEKALHDAIMVISCFNFMNRLLEGHGVYGGGEFLKKRGPILKDYGYAPINKMLEPLLAK